MAKTLAVSGVEGSGVPLDASSTLYPPLTQTRFWHGTTSESVNRRTTRAAGTFSNLYFRCSANATTGTSTARFRKNSANGNQTFTIGAGLTGDFEDTVNTDALASGDTFGMQVVVGAGGDLTGKMSGVLFDADSNTYIKYDATTWEMFSPSASTTYYDVLSGGGFAVSTTEAIRQAQWKTAGTCKHFFVEISANGRSSDTVYTVRKNGANSACTVTFAGAETGIKEDLSNTESVAVDDLLGVGIALGTGTGDLEGGGGVGFESTSGGHMAMTGGDPMTAIGTSLTRYTPPTGHLQFLDTAEADDRADVNHDTTASKLSCYVSTNGISATSTLRLRKNGANSNQSVAITASTTGWFEDASNEDALSEDDEINHQLVTGGSGSTIAIANIGLLLAVAVAAASRWRGPVSLHQAVPRASHW